jgi:hypothetical protein
VRHLTEASLHQEERRMNRNNEPFCIFWGADFFFSGEGCWDLRQTVHKHCVLAELVSQASHVTQRHLLHCASPIGDCLTLKLSLFKSKKMILLKEK